MTSFADTNVVACSISEDMQHGRVIEGTLVIHNPFLVERASESPPSAKPTR